MPATEQTWRNQKRLHQVFAVSCFLMLGTTLWMFVQDHNREWKTYQKNFRRIEMQSNLWNQVQFNNEVVHQAHSRLSSKLLRIQSQPLNAELVEQFKKEVNADAKRRGVESYDFDKLDQALGKHNDLSKKALDARKKASQTLAQARSTRDQASDTQIAANEAQAALGTVAAEERPAAEEKFKSLERQASDLRTRREELEAKYDDLDKKAVEAEAEAKAARDRVLGRLKTIAEAAKFREELSSTRRKAMAAKYDAAKASEGLAVRDGASREELQRLQGIVDESKAKVDELTFEFDESSAHRKRLEEIIKKLTADEDETAKKLRELNADLERLQTAYNDLRSTYFVGTFPFLGKRWLELPILDAFNSPLKIQNLWDNENTIDYNFRRVRRFDRCTTCHQAMEKSMPGKADQPLYLKERNLEFVLNTPTEEELAQLRKDKEGNERELTLDMVYGIRLADEGEYLLDRRDVTIQYVRPYFIDLPVDLGDDGNEENVNAKASSLGAQAQLAASEKASEPVEGEQLRGETLQARPSPSTENLGVAPGLQVGDVIVRVNDDYVADHASARLLLLDAQWGKPMRLTVRRGLPSPYTSHPRLDLFIGSLSPHKLAEFACTICHEGQGSATAFKWASHTPNNELESERWSREYGWFDNHHWIFPMFPERFAQSSCLKCHHDVVELEPSKKFPNPPAPKLMHGYDLIRKYGCFGCHEINGYHGPHKRLGPDLRLEPNYFAAAQGLQARLPSSKEKLEADLKAAGERRSELEKQQTEKQEALNKLQGNVPEGEDAPPEAAEIEKEIAGIGEQIAANNEEFAALQAKLEDLAKMSELAQRLRELPEDTKARHELLTLVERDKQTIDKVGVGMLDSESHKLTKLLQDVETPGTLRKVGPSLRYVARKLDDGFLYDWIRNPKHFRESTRMPRFFGLWKHLEDSPGEPEKTKRYEAVEILGIAAYLKDRSQTFKYLTPPQGDIEPADAARGKVQFQTRGCLACHTHEAFPEANAYRDPEKIIQAPDLSKLAAKFDPERNPDGRKWLYSWIRNPTRYHARTVMPNLFLDPIQSTDADGKVTTSDPIADIVEFLLTDESADAKKWKPKADTLTKLDDESLKTLNELAELNLGDSFSESAVKRYLLNGIPESREDDIKLAETEMVVTDTERNWVDEEAKRRKESGDAVLAELVHKKELLYVGRKAIARYGCYGCHDIPGFEAAKPIGTGLNNWGRKDTTKLAFEHILQYVEHGHGHAAPGSSNHSGDEMHDEHGSTEAESDTFDQQDRAFYKNALQHGHRAGFIYQKLKEPRSFDYHRTENLKYSERLRMPQFPFSGEEREAIITFVLGLVADPPATKFVYDPEPAKKAIDEGHVVLEKYNCGGCHILELERWDISFPQGHFNEPADITTFPFMKPGFSADQIEDSQTADRQGRIHAALVGLPTIDPTGVPVILDDFGDPLFEGEMYNPQLVEYSFDLWQPLLLDGQTWQVGGISVPVPARLIERRYPTRGGMLAKYLVPQVVELERQKGTASASKGKEAWGWVPPPLVGEGKKVQPDWLHDFLLDPHKIRPAVVLRMPKFNMSPAEATKLVNYFAAMDKAVYPYEFKKRRRTDHLAKAEAEFQRYLKTIGDKAGGEGGNLPKNRFDAAMNIVVDKNYCRQCHIVADYDPGGDPKAKAPNLANVYQRLRPNYVRRWIARPAQILPYTAMPENVKYKPQDPVHLGGVSQELFPGTSIEQVDGLVDLLMNFDVYAKDKLDITSLVKERAASATPEGTPGETSGGEASTGE